MTPTNPQPRTTDFRILIVDDDNLIRKFYQVIFKPPRYRVETAVNGEEGLERAREFDPDLIISDVIMPKMDGYQFCENLRREERFANTILLMSSSVRTEVRDAVKALKGGADDYVLKPVDEEQVRAKVDAFLRIKVLQDNLVAANSRLQDTVTELEQHKRIITAQNADLQREKELIINSLKEKSYLLEELGQSNTALEALNQRSAANFDNLVSILARIIEFRRTSNKGHARKVATLSEQIANAMALPAEAVQVIRIAALLHEIGKTAISDEIMLKDPAELSTSDQQVIEQYPLIGERLLHNYEGLEAVALIIRHILEHLDGSGFPDGLRGSDIPLGARIIRVVKDFDELTFISPAGDDYQPVLTQLKALADEKYDDQVLRYLDKVLATSDTVRQARTDHVYISDLHAGMVLAEDLFTESGILLVPAETELNANLIESIRKYNSTDSLSQRITISRQ